MPTGFIRVKLLQCEVGDAQQGQGTETFDPFVAVNVKEALNVGGKHPKFARLYAGHNLSRFTSQFAPQSYPCAQCRINLVAKVAYATGPVLSRTPRSLCLRGCFFSFVC